MPSADADPLPFHRDCAGRSKRTDLGGVTELQCKIDRLRERIDGAAAPRSSASLPTTTPTVRSTFRRDMSRALGGRAA
jgi:hypothetical protein